MEDYLSLILSVAGFLIAFVAFVALLYSINSTSAQSKQIDRISKEHNELQRVLIVGSAHDKYAQVLSDVESRFDALISSLCIGAGHTFEKIVQNLQDMTGVNTPAMEYSQLVQHIRVVYDQALVKEGYSV